MIFNWTILFTAILFGVLFITIKPNKEQQEWYQKLGFKIVGFNITIFNTALAVPYLMSNFQYIACESMGNRQDCLKSSYLLYFIFNLFMLIIFEASYYFFQICMDLNFNIPIEQYKAPWSTLRRQNVIITQIIHIGASLQYIFPGKKVLIILMEVIQVLALLTKNLFKFKNCYYLVFIVNFLDTFLNSFLMVFILLSLLISQIDLPYTFNSLYLLFFISLLFAMALSYVHSFYRASSLQKFFANFQQITEDLDFATNTIIDYLCSKDKKDGVKIKGLVQLIINESSCEAAKKRQKDKIEKYHRYFLRNEERQQQQMQLESRYQDSPSQLQEQYNNYQRQNGNFRFRKSVRKLIAANLQNRRGTYSPSKIGQIYQNDKLERTQQSFISNHMDISEFDSRLDISQINLMNKEFPTEIGMDMKRISTQGQLNNNQAASFNEDLSIAQGADQLGPEIYKDDQNSEDDYNRQENDMLINQLSDNHSQKDINLIIDVIDHFLGKIKEKQTNNDKYIRILLLKIRLIYLSHQIDKMHYLMYLISSLDSMKSSFQVKTIKYIYEKKFQSTFQHKMIEKKDKMTPTTLVFYEHQREYFEQMICDTTEIMLQLLTELRLQNTQSDEILKRFNKAKTIIKMSIDLEKRFKSIVTFNAQQMDLVAMYFHFLDQVVHMENEARDVYKVMVDMSNSDKLNKRFEQLDFSKTKGTGFILVSGNYCDLGRIIKLNNSVCNQLQYFKDDLSGKKIEFIMPDSIAQYHETIIGNYIFMQHEQSLFKSQRKSIKNKINRSDQNFQLENQNIIEDYSKPNRKENKTWHLNEKNKPLMFKTKQGMMAQLTCNFDIYFDIKQGIQFLCLAYQNNQIQFDDQKVQKDSVYIIQTQNYGIIQSCSSNLIKRFGITPLRILDERLDVSNLNEQLLNFSDNNSKLDTSGIPLLLDFKALVSLQNEESRQQMEKYHQKLAYKGRKLQKQLSQKKEFQNSYDEKIQEEDSASHSQLLMSFGMFNSNLYEDNCSQICFVKREIVQQRSYKSQKNYSIQNGSFQGQSQSISSLSHNIDGVNPINQNRHQSQFTSQIQGIYYYIVFFDGMSQQMRDQALQLQEILTKQFMEENKQNNNGNSSSIIFNQIPVSMIIPNTEINQHDIQKIQSNSQTNASQSEDQFTFASTSSSTSSTSKDKITELKNESFLGQVPIFVSLFQKVFIFYFILFVVVGTVILVVAFDSNDNFFNDIESINIAKKLYTAESIVQISFRAYIDIANGIEPNQTSVYSDRFQLIKDQLISNNEQMRLLNNQMRHYVSISKNDEITNAFKSSAVLIKELDEQSSISIRYMSLDQSLQLLTAKISMFTENIGFTSANQTNNPLKCDCSLSTSQIAQKQVKGASQNQVERNAYWIIENTNRMITNQLYDIGQLFLLNSASEVDNYKQQILVLAVCCISLAFLCSLAFIPYYLRMRRNLNLNIYLLEKMELVTIEEISSSIKHFYRQLSSSKGKYGGNSNDKFRQQQNQQTLDQNNNNGLNIPSNDESNKGANKFSTVGTSRMDGKIRRKKHQNGKFTQKTFKDDFKPGMQIKFSNNNNKKSKFYIESMAANQMSLENDPKKKNTQQTFQTYKTTEQFNLGTFNDHNPIEEFKNEEQKHESNDSEQNEHQHSHGNSSKKRNKDKKEAEQNNSQIDQKEQEIQREKKRSLSQMYFKQKLKIVSLSILFSMILSVFFILDYFLIANTFDNSVDSINKFQSYYEIEPCFVTVLQLNREQLVKNETNFFNYGDYTQLSQIFQECFRLDDNIRKLKQNYPSTLEDASSFLKVLDSDKFCEEIMPQIDESVSDCQKVGDGIFRSGYNYAFSTIINYFYMVQVRFDSLKGPQRTQAYLNSELNNMKSIDFQTIYLRFMDDVFALIKNKITQSFQSYYDDRTREFTAVYAVFILVLVISIIFILCFLMKSIQREIYLARKTIQLIPHKELTKQENYDIAMKIKY